MIHRDRRPNDSAAGDMLLELLAGAHQRLDERDERRRSLGEVVIVPTSKTPTQLLLEQQQAGHLRAVS